LEVCRELQQQLQEDSNFLSKVVTGEESCVHGYNPFHQTVNTEFYSSVLMCLREDMRRKCPEKWHMNDWVLHHDNK
jgi:hypothetical protein